MRRETIFLPLFCVCLISSVAAAQIIVGSYNVAGTYAASFNDKGVINNYVINIADDGSVALRIPAGKDKPTFTLTGRFSGTTFQASGTEQPSGSLVRASGTLTITSSGPQITFSLAGPSGGPSNLIATCSGGACLSPICMTDLDCNGGYACINGNCATSCTIDAQCKSGGVCIAGGCATPLTCQQANPATPDLCGNTCTNTLTDPNNCGGCGNVCPSGSICQQGICTCPAGQVTCAVSNPPGASYLACVNTATDPNNCGQCGMQCGLNFKCSGGACVLTPTCGVGQTPCGINCCGLSQHCDSLTNACSPPFCPAEETQCGTSCIDTLTVPNNCGTCGKVCNKNVGEVCIAGGCATPLTCQQANPATPNLCGNTCTNTLTDPNNCGTCGKVCNKNVGEVCIAGGCAIPIPPFTCLMGQVFCNGACTDLNTNSSHCGDCGIQCLSGSTCQAGVCYPYQPGWSCTTDDSCITGFCNKAISKCAQRNCIDDSDCPSDQWCDTISTGTCQPGCRDAEDSAINICLDQGLRCDPISRLCVALPLCNQIGAPPCPADSSCNLLDGQCYSTCTLSSDCGEGCWECIDGSCAAAACCQTDDDCILTGGICRAGRCAPSECSVLRPCDSGYDCSKGRCVQSTTVCSEANPCESLFKCGADGTCTIMCTGDSDCTQELNKCSGGVCVATECSEIKSCTDTDNFVCSAEGRCEIKSCGASDQCTAPFQCGADGKCFVQCAGDSDCTQELNKCSDGACIATECSDIKSCISPTFSCSDSGECFSPITCANCPEGTVCSEGSCIEQSGPIRLDVISAGGAGGGADGAFGGVRQASLIPVQIVSETARRAAAPIIFALFNISSKKVLATSKCVRGARCSSSSDCCSADCISSVCVCSTTACVTTSDCCTGYCADGKCSLPPTTSLFFGSALRSPQIGCAGLIEECAPGVGNCISLCNGLSFLLMLVAGGFGAYIWRTFNHPVAGLLAAFTPVAIGLTTYPFIGIIIGITLFALLLVKD